MKNTVEHLAVYDNKSSGCFHVSTRQTGVVLPDSPLPGNSFVGVLYVGFCGSDVGPHGYYGNGRFQNDFGPSGMAKQKHVADFLKRDQGMKTEGLDSLWRTPGHEAVGIVRDTTPHEKRYTVPVATFVPQIDGGKITGVVYNLTEIDFDNIGPGNLVVFAAGFRCPPHRQIDPETGLTYSCTRDMSGGHKPKLVPGRYGEYPGYMAITDNKGLSYPNSMVMPLPPELQKWVFENPKKRLPLASLIEPFSCCFEALRPIIQNRENPKIFGIVGDGMNSALLSLLITTAFPESYVLVTGKTPSKLQAIRAISPERIYPIQIGNYWNTLYGHKEMMEELNRSLQGEKLDVLIPTIPLATPSDFIPLVKPAGGRVVIWASAQVSQVELFRGIGDQHLKDNPHPSYGGWQWSELTGVEWFTALVRLNHPGLEALVGYPGIAVIPLGEAADPVEQLIRTGRFSPDGGGSSAKVIVDCTGGTIFSASQVSR